MIAKDTQHRSNTRRFIVAQDETLPSAARVAVSCRTKPYGFTKHVEGHVIGRDSQELPKMINLGISRFETWGGNSHFDLGHIENVSTPGLRAEILSVVCRGFRGQWRRFDD